MQGFCRVNQKLINFQRVTTIGVARTALKQQDSELHYSPTKPPTKSVGPLQIAKTESEKSLMKMTDTGRPFTMQGDDEGMLRSCSWIRHATLSSRQGLGFRV